MARKTKIIKPEILAYPHNGEGKPHLRFPDPVNGEMIGGQVAAVRMALRYRHVVIPWARRQGKSRSRQFLIPREQALTPGMYYFGMVLPDHNTAYKLAKNFRDTWGEAFVEDFKINDKDQDRWIKLRPQIVGDQDPPDWLCPRLQKRWERVQGDQPNEGGYAFFWSGKHPHYEGIQGDPHPWHRIDWDEVAQIHPGAYKVVQPMLRDVRGHEMFSGTPMRNGIGNVKFKQLWNIAGDSNNPTWFRMRVPDGTNIHVPAVTPDELVGMDETAIAETMHARFLTGEGAVFGNLDVVISLPFIPPEDAALDWIRAIRKKFAMPSMTWWVHSAKPEMGHTYAMSIDWARSPKGDYSVLSVFDLTTSKQTALLRWRGEDFTAQMEVVLAIQKHYGARELHSDANGMGETMSDFMRRRHAIGFIGHKFGRNKGDYVQRGRVLFQDADVSLIDCAPQRNEFESFSAFESQGLGSEKLIKWCAPEGEHDDIVASFLHLAPTLTISGRRAMEQPEPEPESLFDEHWETTLDLLVGDEEDKPWVEDYDANAPIDLDDIVV